MSVIYICDKQLQQHGGLDLSLESITVRDLVHFLGLIQNLPTHSLDVLLGRNSVGGCQTYSLVELDVLRRWLEILVDVFLHNVVYLLVYGRLQELAQRV